MKENLGFGHLGNGVTVWDRTKKKSGDYLTIAHIGYNRNVIYYADDISTEQKCAIENFAKSGDMSISVTQKGSVLQLVLALRFVYDDIGSCRDIYETKDGIRYCRLEARYKGVDYVSWHLVTVDWEEALCPIGTNGLVHILDKDDHILAIEQNKLYEEEHLATKQFPFSWEAAAEPTEEIYQKIYLNK